MSDKLKVFQWSFGHAYETHEVIVIARSLDEARHIAEHSDEIGTDAKQKIRTSAPFWIDDVDGWTSEVYHVG